MDIASIHKAFSPAEQITDPALFVGRKEQIRAAMTGLSAPGALLSVYGLRGVGKSSVATQVIRLAQGDVTLVKMLALERYLPNRAYSFLVQRISCDSGTRTCLDLLKRIIFGEQHAGSLLELTGAGDRRLDKIKEVIQGEAGANFFGASLGAKGSSEKEFGRYISDDVIQGYKQLLGTVQKDNQGRTGLLIVIDEFDTFADKSAFASIIKTTASPYVKYMLVGIASSVAELVQGHASVGRNIEPVEVGYMPESELAEILSRAEYRVHKEMLFSDEAKLTIAQQAEGFPYFAHLLGREAMLLAFERDARMIDHAVMDELRSRISAGRLKTIYEDIYHAAVKNSPQREILLKAFAESDDDEIRAEDIYRVARGLDVGNPSQYMKELTSPQGSEPVLVKVRAHYYRFTDPVFKVYARIRNWKFS